MALDALPAAAEKRTAVRSMFDRIAPRYDRVNRIMTGGMDQRWRRETLDAIGVGAGDRLVDLACGTGDFTELARARGAQAVGLDFAGEMLRGAVRRRIGAAFVQADATALPLPDAWASVLTCGFALRNFVSLPAVFAEMARVLAPGGRFGLLEVDRPSGAFLRSAHSLYFDRVVPWLGGWLSDRGAYRYLPQSTHYLPETPELRDQIASAGFEAVERRTLLLGAVQVWTGVRLERP